MSSRAVRIRNLRKGDLGDRKISQKELADELGAHRNEIGLYESGRVVVSNVAMTRIEDAITRLRSRGNDRGRKR